jgi:hypothetical protein
MIRRLTAAVLATAVLALLLAAAAPRAEAISFVDKQVQAGGLLIQNYVDKYGMANGFHFPPKTMVKKGGGLPDSTLMWPANPWTGRTMGAGTSRGTYTYTLAANGLSYKLTMHFSSGSYTFKGGIPRWLRSERDQASKQNLLLLQRYVEAAAASSHFYPATGAFTKDAFSSLTWPVNPWTAQAMALTAGPGDYSYTQKNVGIGIGNGYELTTKLSNGDTYKLVQFPVGAPLLTTAP